MTQAVTVAITRPPTDALARCALTHLERQPIDVALAREQHGDYRDVLARPGARVIALPEEPDLPDAVFVEDAVLVVDEIAVLMRPGVQTRLGEVPSVAAAMAPYRDLRKIEEPGTLDGGDIMVVDQTVFVGRSSRSNAQGIMQLDDALRPFGYRVRPVGVHGCLHLKSACTHVGERLVLANRRWIDAEALEGVTILDLPPTEPRAANTLMIGETVVMAAGFPETADLLWQHGRAVETVDLSELQKAEAGGSCMSVVFRADAEKERGET
jgi:dimethylargininase